MNRTPSRGLTRERFEGGGHEERDVSDHDISSSWPALAKAAPDRRQAKVAPGLHLAGELRVTNPQFKAERFSRGLVPPARSAG